MKPATLTFSDSAARFQFMFTWTMRHDMPNGLLPLNLCDGVAYLCNLYAATSMLRERQSR